jgi:hypothetical protein
VQRGKWDRPLSEQGHEPPRRFVTVVAAMRLITATKAINRRDRFGPLATKVYRSKMGSI